jgi:hypothetical protein
MLDAERFLEPDCVALPVCRCGREMYLAFTRSSPKTPEAHIRVYNCRACNHEMHLAIWGGDPDSAPIQVPADSKREFVMEVVPNIQMADTENCCQCNGRVGLIPHRLALKKFCSTHCLNQYNEAVRKVSLIKEWRDIYARKQ